MKKIINVLLIALSILGLSSCSTLTTSPKTCNNCMTDNDITTNVQTRIAGEAGLADNNVHVSTYERVVTLTGTVENPTQADVAYVLACRTPNVKAVISKLGINHNYLAESKGQWYN